MQRLLLILVLLMSACSSKADRPRSESDQEKSKEQDTCDAQISDLSEWMTEVEKTGVSHAGSLSDVDPPMANVSTVRPRDHVTMTVNTEAVLVEGSPVVAVSNGAIDPSEIEPDTASIKKVSSFLRSVKEQHVESKAARAPDSDVDSQTLNLVIDKLTLWNVVVAAAKSASEAGYSRLEIVFKTPPRVASSSPPPPSSVTKEIAALQKYRESVYNTPASDRGDLRNEGYSHLGLLAKLSTTCPPLKKVVDTVGEQDPDKRQAHLTDGVVAAIKQCQCNVEIPALKELYWFSANDGIGIPGVGSVGVAMASSETDGAVVVQAASDSTWQNVHTKVLSLPSSGDAPKVLFKADK